tara:strand:- start:1337 stop:2641 length:1305 start_codon:yes stop_codon:yes gene_type:complete
MKKLKEINLSPSSGTHVKSKQPYYSGYSGGMTEPAASASSSLMGSKKVKIDLEEESEESEEEVDLMPENILKYRVRNNTGYSLNETLSAINEDWELLDTAASGLKYGARALKAAGKSTLLSMPFIDTIAGSMMLVSGIGSFKQLTDDIIEKINVPENTFAQAMSSEDDEAWLEIINVVNSLDEQKRAELEEHFEDVLHNIKTFITTAFQAYDSVFASAGVVGGPVALAAAETGANLTTAIAGFIADTVPWERFALDLTGKFAAMIKAMFDFILGQKEKDESSKMSEAIENGGPIFLAILTHPVRSMTRLGEFYTAIETGKSPIADVASATVGAAKSQITTSNLESMIDRAIAANLGEATYYGIDEDLDEDLDLYSDLNEEEEEEAEVEEQHVVGGFAAPLKSPTKAQQEKLMTFKEDLQRLQDWKLKTTGRTRR